MSMQEYLSNVKTDTKYYQTSAERLLSAIGEPEIIDTSKDAKLSRIFGNRSIKKYKAFEDFYGLEEVIEKIVSFLKHSAQGLEESRQILYLLGPVGSAKSSISERLKELMEKEPIYVLTDAEGVISPIFETPLGLFNESDAEEIGIPARYLAIIPSPWATKRLELYKGDISKFKVSEIYPSQLHQIALCKTEPGDENNQDISTLVGKLDIRKLEFYSQNDPDAYNYSGGLCLANQGLLEFVEMFKAPIKVLHPLLTATQEKNYKGTEALAALPFEGLILAHSNEAEWETFRNNKNNEAFLDRVSIVEVPYCLRVSEEVKIYKKLLSKSSLKDAPCVPDTLTMLAEFCIYSRLAVPENSTLESKIKTYNGENIKAVDNGALSYQEYKDAAPTSEGFTGISTRTAYKILAEVYNFDLQEIAADPVHMLHILEKTVKAGKYDGDRETFLLSVIKGVLVNQYSKKIGKDIQTAYLESYDEYGQSLFDKYILYADHWVQDRDFKDADTGNMYDVDVLDKELMKLEKPARISNSKDFRNEVVNFAIRYQAGHEGKNPDWKSYEKLRKVIEESMFSKTEELLPVISFGKKSSKDEQEKHQSFVDRMKKMGYTEKQVKRVVEWHRQVTKS